MYVSVHNRSPEICAGMFGVFMTLGEKTHIKSHLGLCQQYRSVRCDHQASPDHIRLYSLYNISIMSTCIYTGYLFRHRYAMNLIDWFPRCLSRKMLALSVALERDSAKERAASGVVNQAPDKEIRKPTKTFRQYYHEPSTATTSFIVSQASQISSARDISLELRLVDNLLKSIVQIVERHHYTEVGRRCIWAFQT